MTRVRATRTIENLARRWGFSRVAGCDEVGRGCLAGPVVAGAVILDPGRHLPGLADSKTVPAEEREHLFRLITERALGWAGRQWIGSQLVQAEAGSGLEPAVSWVVLEKQRAASAGCLDGEAMELRQQVNKL